MRTRSVLKDSGKGLVDYLFGFYSVKEYKQIEYFIREFYPERSGIKSVGSLEDQDVDLLKSSIGNIKRERFIPKYIQPILTLGSILPLVSYSTNESNATELGLELGLLALIKATFYLQTHVRIKERKKLETDLKKVINSDNISE
ncbi:MAG: hypothetical protein WC867_04940 [Candidatus Pacearchaeota archaeon]|jgi:hypothetical protein